MKSKKTKIKGFKRLLTLKGEPRYVAKGFALGSFVGMMPIPGFQMLVSLTIATLTKVHKTAAVIGVFNTNLATGAFVFAFNYWLGKNLLGLSPNFTFPDKINMSFFNIILSAGSDVFVSMLVGGLVTGVVSWIISYYTILTILNRKSRTVSEKIINI